jgi:NAD(P)-dependent dehydrogenase (short-subunit alcohol dehydrogenase family)
MKTLLIAGGTDGIGRAVARTYLERGDQVVIAGTTAGKGEAFLEQARAAGAGDRAWFMQADLSLVEENKKVIGFLGSRFAALDALVLCARYHRQARTETADGFESTFALFYLSRYLLGNGLLPLLERAGRPVIANVAGPGGTSPVQWDDLQMARGYHGAAALGHGGRLNDLLAVAFASKHPTTRTRYGLFNPGTTATSFAGEYDQATAAQIARLKTTGKPARQAAAPVTSFIDNPPAQRLSAFIEGRQFSTDSPLFSPADARRLDQLTRDLLQPNQS